MPSAVQRHRVRSPTRVAYVFAAPALFVVSLYLVVFLGLNSRRGSEWLASLVSTQLAGDLEYGYLEIGPDLRRLELYDAVVRDPSGRAVIEIHRLGCSFQPLPLLQRRLMFTDCLGSDGRLLIEEQDGGRMGLVRAFQGDFFRKRRHRNPMTYVFEGITLLRLDVLIQTRDMMLLFERVDLTEGNVVAGGRYPDISANADIPRGRLLMSERMFSLGTGKASPETAEFARLRLTRPWAAARTRLPDSPDRGMLDLQLGASRIDGFHWIRENFRFNEVELNTLDGLVAVRAGGLFGIMPDRPKRPLGQNSGVRFDGHMSLSLHPDAEALDWFFPGVFDPPSRVPGVHPESDPIVFNAWGDVRFANFEWLRLRLRDVNLVRWHFDEVDLGLRQRDGRLELAPDSRVVAYGGTVTGVGSFVPRVGTWDLGLCVADLRVGDMARAWMADPLRLDASLLDVTLASDPAVCDPVVEPGLRLHGDLTRKALEIDPAYTTLPGRPIQDPMLVIDSAELLVDFDRAPLGLPVDTVRASVAMWLDQRGRVGFGDASVPGLVLRAGGDRLAFGGVIDTTAQHLEASELRVSTTGLGRWVEALGAGNLPAGIGLEAHLALQGPLEAPVVSDVGITLRNPQQSGPWPEASVEVNGRVDGDRFVVSDGSVSSPRVQLLVSGALDLFDGSVLRLRPDPGLDLRYALDGVRLSTWVEGIGRDAELAASGRVTGTLGDPVVEADTVELSDLLVAGEPFDRIAAEGVTLSNDDVAITAFELTKAGGLINGHFSWSPRTDEVDLAVIARQIGLRDLRVVSSSGVAVRGEARFDLAVRGLRTAPDVEGAALVTGLEVDRRPIGQVSMAVDTWENRVHVVGGVSGNFGVDLALPIGPDAASEPIRATVRFRQTPLEAYWPAFARSVERSAFTGELVAELYPGQDVRATADLRLDDVLVRLGGREFTVPRPVRASWSAGDEDGTMVQRVRIHELTTGVDGRDVTLRGTVVLDPRDPRLSLSLGGDIDFSLLQLLPDLIVDAEGVADVAIKVFGPLGAPAIDGELIYGNARIAPRGLGTNVVLNPGRFRVETGRIVFDAEEPVTGVLFGGDFSLWGELGLAGIVPDSADLSLFVTDLAYRVPDSFAVTLTGPVQWRAGQLADYDSWSIAGDLTLVDGRFIQDFDIVADQFAFGGLGRGVEQFALPVWMRVPAIGRMTADLAVSGRDRFFVESRVAGAALDLEFRTDLRVTGRLESMDVQGDLEALEGGTVTFRGRTFDADEAVLSFRGVRDAYGYPMPALTSELSSSIVPCAQGITSALNAADPAVTDSDRVFLTAWVSGQLPYDLNFRLESTPFYDQRDQLSLILTGCTVDALTAGSAGAPTLDAVLRPFLDVVERNVEERLDLDQVDVAPSVDGTAGIQIQDEISERFRWTLDAIFGTNDSQRQVVRGEFKVFDWLVLEVQEQTSRDEPVRLDAGVRFRVVLQ